MLDAYDRQGTSDSASTVANRLPRSRMLTAVDHHLGHLCGLIALHPPGHGRLCECLCEYVHRQRRYLLVDALAEEGATVGALASVVRILEAAVGRLERRVLEPGQEEAQM